MTLFPGAVGANFPALGGWLDEVNGECLTGGAAGGCRASSHPTLAGGSGLGSGLALGYHFWQEAPEGPVSCSQTATHFPSSLSHC